MKIQIERQPAKLTMTRSGNSAADWARLAAGILVSVVGAALVTSAIGRAPSVIFPLALVLLVLAIVIPRLARLGRQTSVVAVPGRLQVSDRHFWVRKVDRHVSSADIRHVNAERIDGIFHVHAWVGEPGQRVSIVEGLTSGAEAQRIVDEVREFMELPVRTGDLPGQPAELPGETSPVVEDFEPSPEDLRIQAEIREAISEHWQEHPSLEVERSDRE